MYLTQPARHAPGGRPINPTTHELRAPSFNLEAPPFALVTDNPMARTLACGSLRELAAAIHRRRGGDALALHDERVMFRDQVRDCVAVHAENPISQTRRLIGHAWLRGHGREVLSAALAAEVPAQSFGGRA